MSEQNDAPSVNEGTPPDARTGSTETFKEIPAAAPISIIDQMGPDNYTAYMAQALQMDYFGAKLVEFTTSDLYALIGALDADRLSLGRELDAALQQLASPGQPGAPN